MKVDGARKYACGFGEQSASFEFTFGAPSPFCPKSLGIYGSSAPKHCASKGDRECLNVESSNRYAATPGDKTCHSARARKKVHESARILNLVLQEEPKSIL
jgi:hypothetical protein